jgi:hypothetical protein
MVKGENEGGCCSMDHLLLLWSGVLLCTHTHMDETIQGIIVRAFISSMQAERGLFYENVVR